MINQFLRAGGARNLQEFYNKFPTEEDFNHYMAYGGGLNRFAPGGPILPGTMSTAIADYQQAQAQPAAGANGLPDYLRRPQNQMESFVGPSAPAGWPTVGPIPSNEPKYTGVSIVDMLGGKGKATDFGSRKKFAENIGITGYTGTPDQNTQFIDILNNNPNLIDQYTSVNSGGSGSSSSRKKKASAKQNTDNLPVVPNSSNNWGFKKTALAVGEGALGAGVGYAAYKEIKDLLGKANKGEYLTGQAKAKVTAYRNEFRNRMVKEAGNNVKAQQEWFKKLPKEQQGILKNLDAMEVSGDMHLMPHGTASRDLYTRDMLNEANAEDLISSNRSTADALRESEEEAKAFAKAKRAGNVGKVIEAEKVVSKAKPGRWGEAFKVAAGAAKEIPWIKRLIMAKKAGAKLEYGGPSNQNDTYSAGVSYAYGGSFVPTYGEAALPIYNSGSQAMYGAGYAYGGPTYSKVTQYPHQQYVPAFDWMQDGGMSPEQADQMQEGQPQDQMQDQQQAQQQPPSQDQIMQEVAQMLQQGVPPEQIMQQLAQMGIPQDQAQQMIQMVMQQMQGGQDQAPQGQPQQAPQPGMAYGGKFEVGGEYEMNKNDVQRLLNQGYKIEYL